MNTEIVAMSIEIPGLTCNETNILVIARVQTNILVVGRVQSNILVIGRVSQFTSMERALLSLAPSEKPSQASTPTSMPGTH